MADESFKDFLNDFSLRLYRLYAERDGNIILSPYSISAALLLADLGAKGETDRQIRAAFLSHIVPKTELHKRYRQLEYALNARTRGSTKLSIANRMFSPLEQTVDENFKAMSKEFYDSGVELLDFIGEPENSRMHINNWVADHTENKIQNLLPAGAVGPLSRLILVNAIYFKAEWLNPFDGSNTKERTFYPTKRTPTNVSMMNGTERLKYILDRSGRYSAIELPYKDGSIAMVFVLPTEIEGLADIEKKMNLAFLTNMSRTLEQANRPEVILSIPKFKVETQFQLEHDLPRFGIVDMFDPATANFSGMLPDTPKAFISSVLHKAFVQVDEEGTEAAAVSVLEVLDGCMLSTEPPKRFIADHPFIFFIRDTKSDAVLFIGRYMGPPV